MDVASLFPASVVCMFGLIFGSFFNVLIYRLPRNISIAWPGSKCPTCNHPLSLFENIPIVSYLFLGGKCSHCKTKIPIQYPLVEGITGCASLILWYTLIEPFLVFNPIWWIYGYLILQTLSLLLLIPVSFIDLYHYIIPDSISLGGLGFAIVIAFIPGGISPLESGLGVIAGGGTLFLIGTIGEWVLKKEAMGFGDVKLMAFIGAVWGWKIALLGILYGSFFGSVLGIICILIRLLQKNHKIPFGPFLSLGVWVAFLFGDKMVTLYLETIEKLFL